MDPDTLVTCGACLGKSKAREWNEQTRRMIPHVIHMDIDEFVVGVGNSSRGVRNVYLVCPICETKVDKQMEIFVNHEDLL